MDVGCSWQICRRCEPGQRIGQCRPHKSHVPEPVLPVTWHVICTFKTSAGVACVDISVACANQGHSQVPVPSACDLAGFLNGI